MGRGKLRKKRKQKLKRQIQKQRGKLVRFVLSNSQKKYNGWRNKFSYQSNIHNLIYKGASFENDKFQNCIITDCNFKNTKLTNVDFSHCNLKGSSFAGAHLCNVVFFNCKINDTDFKDSIFDNVVFICQNFKGVKNLEYSKGCYEILNKYPVIEHSDLINSAKALANCKQLYKFHVLNINTNKVNRWNLYYLAKQYSSYDDVARGLCALGKRRDKRNFITLGQYKKHLDSYLKI